MIINDVLVQKGSGEAMLVKFLNPFDDKLNLFWGHQTGAVQKRSLQQIKCSTIFNNYLQIYIISISVKFNHTEIE